MAFLKIFFFFSVTTAISQKSFNDDHARLTVTRGAILAHNVRGVYVEFVQGRRRAPAVCHTAWPTFWRARGGRRMVVAIAISHRRHWRHCGRTPLIIATRQPSSPRCHHYYLYSRASRTRSFGSRRSLTTLLHTSSLYYIIFGQYNALCNVHRSACVTMCLSTYRNIGRTYGATVHFHFQLSPNTVNFKPPPPPRCLGIDECSGRDIRVWKKKKKKPKNSDDQFRQDTFECWPVSADRRFVFIEQTATGQQKLFRPTILFFNSAKTSS